MKEDAKVIKKYDNNYYRSKSLKNIKIKYH